MGCRICATYILALIYLHCEYERVSRPPETNPAIYPRQHDSKSFPTMEPEIRRFNCSN
jgi:hypothetical protein